MTELVSSPVFTWVTSGALVTAASVVVSTFWERRKLSRGERAHAYSDFLAAASRQWRAFGDRDGAKKRGDESSEQQADNRVREARNDLYEAYTMVQVLGSPQLVKAALELLRLGDDRNRSAKGVPGARGVGVEARGKKLSEVVFFMRKDLGVKELDRGLLRRPSAPGG